MGLYVVPWQSRAMARTSARAWSSLQGDGRSHARQRASDRHVHPSGRRRLGRHGADFLGCRSAGHGGLVHRDRDHVRIEEGRLRPRNGHPRPAQAQGRGARLQGRDRSGSEGRGRRPDRHDVRPEPDSQRARAHREPVRGRRSPDGGLRGGPARADEIHHHRRRRHDQGGAASPREGRTWPRRRDHRVRSSGRQRAYGARGHVARRSGSN